MAPLKLYWVSGSTPAWRVQVCMEEKGLQYESKQVEFSKKEHKGPEVMSVNPRGQVPTLLDGDIVICESVAALFYLEDAYPEHKLLPTDKKERAAAYQRTVESANLQDKVSGIVRLKMFNQNPDPEAVAKAKEALKNELKYWEDYTKSGYVAGSSFTLADTAVGPFVLALKRFGASLKEFPNVAKYADTLQSRPTFQKTTPPHWKETPNQDWLSDM
ncbi:g7331 [Coccomyxa viridis]|uniref:G7331 protein n=1 Tax=Coccomyxa viridis TaxID=1274662 RepID=A0ABP1FXK0_9CHLO